MDDMFLEGNILLCRKVHETTPKERIIVSLKSGETIFEDRIKGQEVFWKRLKKYIESTSDLITNIRFQHFNGVETFPCDCRWYYFIRRQFGNLGEGSMDTFRLGYSNDDLMIYGIEVGYGCIGRFEIDFCRGGFGLVRNF